MSLTVEDPSSKGEGTSRKVHTFLHDHHAQHTRRFTCRCTSGRRSCGPLLSSDMTVGLVRRSTAGAARCRKPSSWGVQADASSGTRDGRCFAGLGDLHSRFETGFTHSVSCSDVTCLAAHLGAVLRQMVPT